MPIKIKIDRKNGVLDFLPTCLISSWEEQKKWSEEFPLSQILSRWKKGKSRVAQFVAFAFNFLSVCTNNLSAIFLLIFLSRPSPPFLFHIQLWSSCSDIYFYVTFSEQSKSLCACSVHRMIDLGKIGLGGIVVRWIWEDYSNMAFGATCIRRSYKYW